MPDRSRPPAATLRARVRAEMSEEIKQTARRHLAEHGAPDLSLRAVAREMGMVSSAIYRYFGSRDDLLTALIIDAYDALGDEVEAAVAAVDRADLIGRHTAICHAARDWALANPHEYALIYGSPVPGYAAPQDTVGPASRVVTALISVLVDGVATGVLRDRPGDRLSAEVDAEMRRFVQMASPDIPPTLMARGMISWTLLFGAISFDVFGRLNDLIADRRAWFEHEIRAMAQVVGLRL